MYVDRLKGLRRVFRRMQPGWLLVLALISGCGSVITPVPVDTPVLVTPTAVVSPTPTPVVDLGYAYAINEAGYSFQSIKGLQVTLATPEATLKSPDQMFTMTMVALKYDQQKTVEDFLVTFLKNMEHNFQDFKLDAPAPVTVNGKAGLSVNIFGSLSGTRFQGRVVVVPATGNLVFYSSAIAFTKSGKDYWKDGGKQMFQAVIDSIRLFEPKTGSAACPISSDPTYGYSPDNPIQVGGDTAEGAMRERMYLDLLRGPQGELVNYQPNGTKAQNGTNLDVYDLRYEGQSQTVSLYLDVTRFQDLKAPSGMTCSSPFPLVSP